MFFVKLVLFKVIESDVGIKEYIMKILFKMQETFHLSMSLLVIQEI